MIEFKDINAIYDVIDCKKVIFEEEFENEFGEIETFESASKFILLSPDTKGFNNILIVKYYDYYVPEDAYDIVSNVVDSMIKWDLVSDNIDKGMIVVYGTEGTTSDIAVLTDKNFETIKECQEFMDKLDNIAYKYCKLENGKLVKLI